jgi:hypothetical protein
MRYLRHGHGSLLSGTASTLLSNPTVALTALGLAWGVYDTMSNKGTGATGQWGGATEPPMSGSYPSPAASAPVSPAPSTPLPPLPNIGGSAAASGVPSVSDDALRIVRLAVSAASADGAMNEQERAAVIQQARAAGVGEIVERELEHRRPLGEIVAGVTDPGQRATLYVLAYTVLRADEQVTGAERIYLAQLAHLLGLDPEATQRLEKDTGERIDALGDQGQLGG